MLNNNGQTLSISYNVYQIIIYPNSGNIYVLENVNHSILSDNEAAIVLQSLMEDKKSGIALSEHQVALFKKFVDGGNRELAK